MRPTSLLSLLSVSALCFLHSCDQDYLLEPSKPELVVEGWIEDDGFPVVILTTTLPISEEGISREDLSQYLLKWAKVTVSDGENAVSLTGKYDDGYFPPYIYTTGRMRGQAGKTYSLTVEYRDFYATATTTIPDSPLMDGYKVEPCELDDSLFRITVSFRDYPGRKNYYQCFSKVGGDTKQYLASMLGSIDDPVSGESRKIDVTVYRGHILYERNYTPFFRYNDTVGIKISHLDETSFNFWYNFTKSRLFASNMFCSTADNLPSNINGGSGYWCGYGSFTKEMIIREEINN